MDYIRWGASPEEWHHLDMVLGLGEDLLPVVSNPNAPISPRSNMKALGKTPSTLNGQGQAIGYPGWTQVRALPQQIRGWSQNPDYGICIQTRRLRAVDVDITDAAQAAQVLAALPAHLPRRVRANSAKFLVAFECEGNLPKRTIRTAHGIIEFLGNGQQFVAVGTHPSGARYEWVGGLPDQFPVLTVDELEALWV